MTGKKVNGITSFEHKWGYHVKELAESELIKPEALHMRVRNYGNPFQRKPKPSVCEIMYGQTLFEKAIELTEEDFSKINTMLPPELRKDNWIVSNFTQGGLYTNYLNLEESITKKFLISIRNGY